MWGSGGTWVTLYDVISAPLMTWPVLTMSIILCVLSVILTLFVLLHTVSYTHLTLPTKRIV